MWTRNNPSQSGLRRRPILTIDLVRKSDTLITLAGHRMTESIPDVEIVGTSVLHNLAMVELFEHGMRWITKHWEKESRPVTRAKLCGKTIGRNVGFVMEISISNPFATVRYFAKVQRAHMDTIMTHYLLKNTNSGPDVFLVVPLENHVRDGRYGEGVITMEVPNFKMASALTTEERILLRTKTTFLEKQFFLMTVLSGLGHFAAIPYNRDNWGYASDPETRGVREDTFQRLALVNFSSCPDEGYHLYSKRSFMNQWKENYTSYGTYRYWKADVLNSAKLKQHVRCFPWLQSPQSFTALLQRVMRSTEAWLQCVASTDPDSITAIDSMDRACKNTRESLSSMNSGTSLPMSSSAVSTSTTGITGANIGTGSTTAEPGTLTIPPHILTLRTTAPYHVRELVWEYKEWVSKWNRQCEHMFEWMPFPKRAKVKYTVQVGVVKLKSHLRRRQVTYKYRM